MKKILFDKETENCIQKDCVMFDICQHNSIKKNKDKNILIPQMFFDIDNGDAYCKTFEKTA